MFDDAAGLCPLKDFELSYYVLGAINGKIANEIFNYINPTLNLQPGNVASFPIIKPNNSELSIITNCVKQNVTISNNEWDTRETSWDFKTSPLFDALLGDISMFKSQFEKSRHAAKIKNGISLHDAYKNFVELWRIKFFQLHQNEEELNRMFIDIYGLQDELTPDVPMEDITILKEETSIENGELVFHAEEIMAQYVSYSAGCMFGRYSLDKEGLILANQGETLKEYFEKVGAEISEFSFLPDEDNIIPILDDEWFEDDIVNRFATFLKASFGKDNFEKNLAFVEESLGMDMRKYFTRNFYADHIKRYKKRPIYWMFSSPKGSFNVLIYMHRYTPDTLNQILNGYLREYKDKISAHMEHLNHLIETGTSSEATKAAKQLDKYNQIVHELQDYEREILLPLATERITIDLDNGVLVNYNMFGTAIKEVPGLNDKATKKKVKEFDWINADEIV